MTKAFLEPLIKSLSRLPAIGRRSAERIAYRLIEKPDLLIPDLIAALTYAQDEICCCQRCGNITIREKDPCSICISPTREPKLCLVEDAGDIDSLEAAGGYKGRYHAFHGCLSPMRGIGPAELKLDTVKERIRNEQIEEVIIALNTGVESDATAVFLMDALRDTGVKVSRVAYGIPAGSGLEYADGVTLSRAMQGRHVLD